MLGDGKNLDSFIQIMLLEEPNYKKKFLGIMIRPRGFEFNSIDIFSFYRLMSCDEKINFFNNMDIDEEHKSCKIYFYYLEFILYCYFFLIIILILNISL